ncbi:MAG: MarR family winged helix-turn-helix transcriptional regulator [Bosea sp. (in: a-proteobacteria)]
MSTLARLTSQTASAAAAGAEEPIPYEMIELFFFAYRDFVGGPDKVLAEYGFGRAHHRVLHFVDRKPGLTIAALLDILQITKQSLNRVLKELVDKGHVEVRPGLEDRRQRQLFTTASGHHLAHRMAEMQGQRVSRALRGAFREAIGEKGSGVEGILQAYLLGLVDQEERVRVSRFLGLSKPATGKAAAIKASKGSGA